MTNTGSSHTQSLVAMLERRAARSPHRTALSIWVAGRRQDLSYGALFGATQALGSRLISLGVSPGDRVVILSESRPEWAIGFFAILFAGAVAVPIDPRIEDEELHRIVRHCEPRVILLSEAFRYRSAVLPPDLAVTPLLLSRETMPASPRYEARHRIEDVAIIAYTSGTTGSPKGVMISGANLLFEMRSMAALHKIAEDDVFLSILPLNHLLELTCGLMTVLYAGGQVVYAGTLLPQELVGKIRTCGVTSMIGVPAVYRTFKKAAESLPSTKLSQWVDRSGRFLSPLLRRLAGVRLRRFISGGSPLDIEVLSFFDALGVPIYQGYGLTETSPVISVNGPQTNRLGSVGRLLAGTEIRIAVDGEILVRGPQVMRGYYREPELTAEVLDAEGWLHTGDLGRIEEGFLYITGRLKDLIVLGDGRKVHPEEVEAVLSRSPRVKEVCVLGVPTNKGEQVCAVVVPSESAAQGQSLEEEVEREMRGLASKLRDFKRPRRVLVRFTELPRTRTLKVRRNEVRSWVRSQR